MLLLTKSTIVFEKEKKKSYFNAIIISMQKLNPFEFVDAQIFPSCFSI